MDDRAYVGVDVSDLDVRVAYWADGKAYTLRLPPEVLGPSITFDPFASIASLGVGFPSIRAKLGTHQPLAMNQRTETAETLTEQTFVSVIAGLRELTHRTVGGAAIAVPAAMGQAGRKALLECARTAGFENTTLIDRCTAAAMGHHGSRDKAMTSLAYSLGYGVFEYALVRMARGRSRAVASGTGPQVSGELFDALIMEAIVLALREKNIFLGLTRWTGHQWLDFRHLAATSRIALSQQDQVEVPLLPEVTGLDGPIKIRLCYDQFAAKVAPLVDQTIEALHAALDQNEIEVSDVDAVLLVGETAQMRPVSDRLSEAFPQKLRRPDAAHVAIGAALQAAQLAQVDTGADAGDAVRSAGPAVESAGPDADEAGRAAHSAPAHDHETVPVVVSPDRAVGTAAIPEGVPMEATGQDRLTLARRLLDTGQHQMAMSLIEDLAREIEELRARLRQGMLTGARALIQQAGTLLEGGQPTRAVALSHQAYELDPNDPEVFAGMMRMHVQAALKLDRPEEYDAAIQHLMCAHQHDRTDRNVHNAIAERHYRHALVMRKLNNLSRCRSILEVALTYAPKHEGANALLAELIAADSQMEPPATP